MLKMETNIRPPFSADLAGQILQRHYGLSAAACHALPSELDRNFYLRASQGDQFVLKIAHSSVADSALDLQTSALRHLRARLAFFPAIVPARSGVDTISLRAATGESYRARLLSYIDGLPLSDFRPHSAALLADIGMKLGQLSAAMQSFQHTEKRLDYRWNIRNLTAVAGYASDLPPDKLDLLKHFLRLYTDQIAPALPALRHSHIYNDANDSNILISAAGPAAPSLSGFIDFGDMVYAPAMADLAIALAYVMMKSPRPLEKAAPLLRAYHAAFPLSEDELRLLYGLVAARLCLSVCISWHQQRQEPANRHLSVSESAAWDLLARWRELHPRLAHYSFRAACGLPACPKTASVASWLERQSPAPMLGYALNAENSRLLDLGMSSPILAEVADLADPRAYEQPLRAALGDDKVGIGYYDEVRPIYLTEMFAIDHHRRRTVHIGVDVFAAPGTPIYAPLAGRVHSIANHPEEQDNGPVLIIRHQPLPDLCFYTLYGHIAPEALHRWQPGQALMAGDLIAHIGDYPANGNWTPHLHFQIISDMLDFGDTFPGVAPPDARELWTSLCPDPNLILRLPYAPRHAPKPSREQLLRRRQSALNPALSLSYQQPLQILRAYRHHLYDQAGQPYLDCVNNVPHVGHGHRRVLRAARQQQALLNTNTRYLHPMIIDYAEALCATLPEPLSVCFFVNSGSEANELALRLAKAYTGGGDIIVIDHAYHGHTSALIDISPYKFNGAGGGGRPEHVQVAEMPDGFRGACRGYGADAGEYYARSVAERIAAVHERGARLSAFVAEGIMGCGGQMPLPEGYLKRSFKLVHAAGGLCIADEVQTGFGRVGAHFWAFELGGAQPDIVTMGKPMGNGHPLGAVATSPEIASAFVNGMEYFNTFGGNPVSCAIGLETLRVIADEDLQANGLDTGAYWLERLHALQGDFPIIGQARGSGLFLGIDLVRDAATREAADWEAAYIVERMKGRGVLLSTEGPLHNVLKLKPPLIFQREHVDLFVDLLAEVLGDTALGQG